MLIKIISEKIKMLLKYFHNKINPVEKFNALNKQLKGISK